MTTYAPDSSNFGADGAFFHVIRDGLAGLVDGDDYFDVLADDVVAEYVISVPGYPKRVEGRQAVIDLYAGYDDVMAVHTADGLRVYRDPEQSVVVAVFDAAGWPRPTEADADRAASRRRRRRSRQARR